MSLDPVSSGTCTSVDTGVAIEMLSSKASKDSAGAVTTGIGSSGIAITTSVGVGHVTLSERCLPDSINGRTENIWVASGTGVTGSVTTEKVSSGSISSTDVGHVTLSDKCWPEGMDGKMETISSAIGVDVSVTSITLRSDKMKGVAEVSSDSGMATTVGSGQIQSPVTGPTGAGKIENTSSDVLGSADRSEPMDSAASAVREAAAVGARPVRLRDSSGGKNGKMEKISPGSSIDVGIAAPLVGLIGELDLVAVTFFVTVILFVEETVFTGHELLAIAPLELDAGTELSNLL